LFVHPSFCLRSTFAISSIPERRISLGTTMAQWQINGGDSRKDTMFDESKKLDILAA
jgi:hypothetical protein